MLESLYVKNLALIDRAEIAFTEGLNVLSGETGAGKSVLIGSVLIALGAKVPKDIIRNHEKEAYVELVFSIDSPSLEKKLSELEISPEDGQVVISRKITADRTTSRINGEACTAKKLKEVSGLLIDVYGQRDHQTLLKPENQLAVIDRWNPETEELKKKHRRLYEEHRKLLEEKNSYMMDEDERIRKLDILAYEINELEEADVKPGEEEALLAEWKYLSGREKLLEAYRSVHSLLDYDTGACSMISEAQRQLQQISGTDARAEALLSELADAESILADAEREAESAVSEAEDDERDPSAVEERLDIVRHLLSKYRTDEDGLARILKEKQEERDVLVNLEARREACEKEEKKAFARLKESAQALTVSRKKSAGELSLRLVDAMKELNFLDVRFEAGFSASPSITAKGADEVCFLISTNPGEELKPLSAVASGGELSRIMLALKSVLARNEETPTLIFDEIDTGISGITAQKVGKRLEEIASFSQVICISHLAQIVSLADSHFLIEKKAENDATATHISLLDEEGSVRELGRLLGGDQITDAVLETARELKKHRA